MKIQEQLQNLCAPHLAFFKGLDMKVDNLIKFSSNRLHVLKNN